MRAKDRGELSVEAAQYLALAKSEGWKKICEYVDLKIKNIEKRALEHLAKHEPNKAEAFAVKGDNWRELLGIIKTKLANSTQE